ncbi:TetR/AcrR family transcriptional regulator [Streptoalloteichus hindustanus]|uniref:Transcriptional regulator, TetR family n=1 Tax=Streptoalloteichus hindustanus TaxID=2017 RepID=A0A1M5HYU1_STRHI|nr:TetR/AcrR family transcriptional regulator [Streptoalloteichus hindustanus]SHG21022.1 transcriptional regulator, TetR family [Streptoalloteichus hindustanus]
MVAESRRERKKRQVRQQLTEAAVRLFGEQGYERTTVAQIAAAADVATKTFFNHFPSKEDVLFADSGRHAEIALGVIADRRPGEDAADLLLRVYEVMREDFVGQSAGRDPELMGAYARLLMSDPTLQALALRRSLDVQRRIADALVEAYPDTLDPVSASAAVGALVGAAQSAALRSMELGEPEEQFWASTRRGVEIGLRGLR